MIHFGLPAYFGPGAGFAFLGSLLSLVSAALAGIVSVVFWPFRIAWLILARPARTRFTKAIFLGFEGLDPTMTEKLMAEGRLPNLARLRDQGSYRRMRTTFPALSPVAWSTFATGVNPAKHNVFDCMPDAQPHRKSEPFWKLLGRHAVRSTILTVPGTSAPEAFNGRELCALPSRVSYPRYYASYLAKLLGDGIGAESIFFSALDNTRRGILACVFDTTAKVQDVDRIVGETLARADAHTAVFVLSDHGFSSFRRSVNLNSWLLRERYLTLTPEGDVDWARTRAYASGLSGMYLNLRGREARGIVRLARAAGLKDELVAKLAGLVDEETGETAIHSVHLASDLYHGPYLNAGPDIVIGYAAGYCASWDAANGRVSRRIFDDSPQPSCGELCADPSLVPGVLFSNLKITADDPGIEDMAPTALSLFGVRTPVWMEGRSVVAAA